MRVRATVAGLAAITVAAAFAIASPAQATSSDIVINEVYGGGGNSGAPFSRDFVELVNTSAAAVDVSGWSIQYASAAGTSWQVTKLTGSIPARGVYLVAEGAGQTPSQPLPTPDVDGTIAMSATAGKVALVTRQTALACGSACHAADGVRDYVGFGAAANDSETAPTGTLSNSTSASRTDSVDTDNNATDFTVGDPNPANGSSPPVEPPVAAKIHDIQGASHRSPLDGKRVKEVTGVVTAVGANGFWMQDPQADTNPATSEGIFVFTNSAPTAVRGNAVSVEGKVTEYRPGGDANNLTTTEIATPKVTVTAATADIPAATLVGPGGLRPPQAVRADAPSDVEGAAFDPTKNALDFYESLEGMLLRVHDATAAGPTNSFGELPVLPGGYGKPRSERGGVIYSYADPNTERLFLTDLLAKIPDVNVGDKLVGDVVGPLDYSFGNFMLAPLASPTVKSANLQRETTRRTLPGELSVATFNVENLSPVNDQAKFDNLAKVVVNNLRAPDLLAIEEIQDNNGPGKGGMVAADQTWAKLIAAIKAAGGPAYDYRQIDPVNNTDGGAPDANIRQGFLFRTDRGLRFVDRPGGDAATPVAVTGTVGHPRLSISPGRIAPADAAWDHSRKPLAGEFSYRGRSLFVVANHFNSKIGDQPIMGRFQPPTRSTETQRHAQATLVKGFVDQVQAKDRNAAVVVLGDLNDFQFSETANILTAGAGLVDLPRTLPANQQYGYSYEGNSEMLDHILVSRGLTPPGALVDYDIVHVNSEFHDQVSDHDPQVVRIRPILWH